MTNAKSTKKALLISVFSLLLCFAMLIGTTFAWFTDSVTSANNIIRSGNLDIELKYAQIDGGRLTDWDTVGGKDNVFDKNALWEPGRVEVAYLEVANLGSLALKYQLGVNVVTETAGVNVEGEEFKLSDHLVFKVVTLDAKPTAPYTRDEAIAASGSVKGLRDYNSQSTPLEVNGTDYVAMIVYMPETVGNEANYRGDAIPTITFGINLFATQHTYESDSFDNQYDKDANLPKVSYGTVAGEDAEISAGAAIVNVPKEAGDGSYKLKIDNIINTVNANDEVVVSFDLSLEKDGVPVVNQTGVEYEVEYFVGTELQIVKLLHKGVAINDYSYDPATGYITFKTASFSPFEIIYVKVPEGSHKVVVNGKTQYFLDIYEAVDAANGETVITLGSDIVLDKTLVFDNDAIVSLDMNGFSISGQLKTLVKLADGSLSVTNGSFKNIHDQAGLVHYNIYMCGDAKAEIKNVAITTTGIGIMMTENSKITELNATVDSMRVFNDDNCFDAISLIDNAKIDKISGGNYQARYTEDFTVLRTQSGFVMNYDQGCALRLNAANAYVGEISGGTFLSVDDVGGMGAPIYVNNGTLNLISGGHFGFTELGVSYNTFNSIFEHTTNGGKINAITGGTFVKGSYGNNRTGFKWDFAGLVDASGCKIVDTGKTSQVFVQFSTKLNAYSLAIIEVVAK